MWATTQKNTHGGVSYILKAALSGNNGCKTKNTHKGCFCVLEAPPGIGPGMRVLQTRALPLGYGAGWNCLYIIAEEMTFVKRFFRDFQKIFRKDSDACCQVARRKSESAVARQSSAAAPGKIAEVIRNHRAVVRRFSTEKRTERAPRIHVATENSTRKNAIATPAVAAPMALSASPLV